MIKTEGYSGKVVSKVGNIVVFSCGAKHRISTYDLVKVGDIVLIDKNGSLWVKK